MYSSATESDKRVLWIRKRLRFILHYFSPGTRPAEIAVMTKNIIPADMNADGLDALLQE
jgi:hypothetical protein